MANIHSETFVVRATECDAFRRMRPDALFIRMQEGGEHHAVTLGFGHPQLLEKGLFFVLARIHVTTTRAPRIGETVRHTTWPGKANRFFCPRFHVFELEDGTPLAAAGALWVLLDTRERKIISPLKCDLVFPDNSDVPDPIALPAKLHLPTGEETHLTRTPSYSDYDINGHVNNTKYIAWLCDALGLSALEHAYPGELIAGYEKEIRATDPLNLTLARNGNEFSMIVCSAEGEKHFAIGGLLRPEEDAQ